MVVENRGAVSVTVPLLMVSVWVVVVESVIADGVVRVVVSRIVVASKIVLVKVPRFRIEEQYDLPSSACSSSVIPVRVSQPDADSATAIPAEARSRRER